MIRRNAARTRLPVLATIHITVRHAAGASELGPRSAPSAFAAPASFSACVQKRPIYRAEPSQRATCQAAWHCANVARGYGSAFFAAPCALPAQAPFRLRKTRRFSRARRLSQTSDRGDAGWIPD